MCHPLVQLQIVLFFVYTGVEIMLGQWSYSILIDHGFSGSVAGVCTGAYWGGIAVGRFVLGAAIDRFGADRLLRYSTIAIVAGAILFAAASGVWAASGLILAGLALAPVFPTLMARAPERLGPSVALHAIGFKVSAAMVGGAVFPAVGGLLADAAGLNAIPGARSARPACCWRCMKPCSRPHQKRRALSTRHHKFTKVLRVRGC
jgi:fucose permease